MPDWTVDIAPAVTGKSVAVVDEIADTGQTLALASARARELSAAQVVTACLIRHSWPIRCPMLPPVCQTR